MLLDLDAVRPHDHRKLVQQADLYGHLVAGDSPLAVREQIFFPGRLGAPKNSEALGKAC